MTDLQTRTVSYDPDTGVLSLTLTNDATYVIPHPGHARQIKEKISPGGRLTVIQRDWLEQYRVKPTGTPELRQSLREKLATLRTELRAKKR